MDRIEMIARLNDLCRSQFGGFCTVRISPGITRLPIQDVIKVRTLIERFAAFTPENDPKGDHSFGVVEYDGVRVVWKVSCLTYDLLSPSPDPADVYKTRRVMDVMLETEWQSEHFSGPKVG